MTVSDDDVRALAGAVMTLVNQIRRGQAKAFNPELVAVLEVLARRGDLTPSELADALPAPASSVSRRVKALSEGGWVTVTPDARDRRSYRVVLSPAGRAELDRLIRQGLDVFAELIKDWNERDVREYTALTRRLTSAEPPPDPPAARTHPWWKES
ncbi:MarR family winged helix-turn-helix transcriptional regulator [Rugosimonospora africana]|uniref:MarR family winged helix-turn-helix transcriptional regulator n=1 Tax=Rugosimonospora africana TaxID=556532 RepID=UPI001942835A|nr:MarR family transcriptional regulator [Rugosimonospora africana]